MTATGSPARREDERSDMYFLVTTIIGFYQRLAQRLIQKRERYPVLFYFMVGVVLFLLLWGIPSLLDPIIPRGATYMLALLFLGPLFFFPECSAKKEDDEKSKYSVKPVKGWKDYLWPKK